MKHKKKAHIIVKSIHHSSLSAESKIDQFMVPKNFRLFLIFIILRNKKFGFDKKCYRFTHYSWSLRLYITHTFAVICQTA